MTGRWACRLHIKPRARWSSTQSWQNQQDSQIRGKRSCFTALMEIWICEWQMATLLLIKPLALRRSIVCRAAMCYTVCMIAQISKLFTLQLWLMTVISSLFGLCETQKIHRGTSFKPSLGALPQRSAVMHNHGNGRIRCMQWKNTRLQRKPLPRWQRALFKWRIRLVPHMARNALLNMALRIKMQRHSPAIHTFARVKSATDNQEHGSSLSWSPRWKHPLGRKSK